MFEQMKYNLRLHRLLRRLARQRVGMLLQPGNVWVLEYAVQDTEEIRALLHTCQLRGWVEILHESVPSAKINPDGSLPHDFPSAQSEHIWRLTDSGWAAIQRSHQLTILGIVVALVGLAVAIAT